MGGAQPLAAVGRTCCLAVECDETRIDMRLKTGYLDEKTDNLKDAIKQIKWTSHGEAKSIGLIGNAAEIFPQIYDKDRPMS